MTRLTTIALALALAALPVVLRADNASCSLFSSSYADSIVNPSKGEDSDFFVNTGGIPNIMFLVDNSKSMRRMPPDGASQGWGTFEPTGNATAGAGFGCANAYANALVFHSSCGTTTLEGRAYNPDIATGGNPPVWAEAKGSTGQYCPYMISGNQAPATDRPGFDPDFSPKFFNSDRVYHDTLNMQLGVPDGWDDVDTSPHAATSVANYCSGRDTQAKRDSCAACMKSNGYWFDGTYLTAVGPSCGRTADCAAHTEGTCIKDSTGLEYSGTKDGSAHCKTPNVWFSGNFLNFYPPKFIVARKILKDTLAAVRKIRLGITRFGTSGWNSIPVLDESLNPSCNMLGSPSSFDANRSAVKTAINQIRFDQWTPLAETLLSVGRLYTSRSLTYFNSTYDDANFLEGTSSNQKSVCFNCQRSSVLIISDGLPTRDGKIPDTSFASSAMTQTAADTAGVYAGKAGYNITRISSTDCPLCNTDAEKSDRYDATNNPNGVKDGDCMGNQSSGACDDNLNAIPSYLPKVAWYLQNVDLRPDTEADFDGALMTKKQTLTTYTIGLGTRGNASLILDHTAQSGGGLYNGGLDTDVVDAKALRDAIMKTLEDVNTRSTSFGAAALSPLQAAAAQGVLVPRFEPSSSPHWNGHLYQFKLFSEFAGGCYTVSSNSGPANGDYDCDGKCNSVFLQDGSGQFIMENGEGLFVVNDPPNRASCGFGNKCGTGNCATASTATAVPLWDAGDKLAAVDFNAKPPSVRSSGFKPWNERRIFTVVDKNHDGNLTADDKPLVQLDGTEAQANELTPYLNIKGSGFCSDFASRLVKAGNPVGNTIRTELAQSTPQYTACARTMIQYMRGADIFNDLSKYQTGACSTYPSTYCTRPYQLGDVFHSSPVEVHAPLVSDGILCDGGYDAQCLASLYRTPTRGPSAGGNANAYDDYAKSSTYHRRNKFALVGANDGLLHAFHTAVYDTTAQKYSERPEDTASYGEEIWAFAPPDLLPKMPLFLGSTHQFFVDGTPMVRDAWFDGGQGNRLNASPSKDGVKQGAEFHTVAVVGERRGGTHYFALDVTDAGKELDAQPRFLWIYPQPTSAEQLAFGETYADFTPTPPPIGPVRIDAGAPPCAADVPSYDGGSGTRCYKEKWIAFLSGGFDPQYTKGRGVHMVDLETGEELFDFSQPSGGAGTCSASSDPRCFLNYPVAASVGMMSWGRNANQLGTNPNDYFFDTATFGDTGGQVWVIRFNEPGVRDPAGSGLVNNWFGARVLQQDKGGAMTCGLDFCETQPFFYITSNVALSVNGAYRVLLGTGDRFNLLDVAGGTCSAENLRACVTKGCSVKLDDGAGNAGAVYGVSSLGTQSYHMDHPALCSRTVASTYSMVATTPPGGNCTSVTTRIGKFTISCPSTTACSGVAESSAKSLSLSCQFDANNEKCEPASLGEPGLNIDVKGNPDKKNWFFSIKVFEASGDRSIFRTLDEAKLYDGARLSDRTSDLVLINDHDADPTKPLASPDGLGWRYYFDHGEPSTVTPADIKIGSGTYHIWRTDERVASTTGVGGGCAYWNTMQPAVLPESYDPATECPRKATCTAGKSQLSYLYGASPATGGQCLVIDNATQRSQKNETLVPPHMGKLVAYLSQNQVSFGLTTVRIPQGGSNISLGEAQDFTQLQEWLPIDRATHACRHSDKNGAAPTTCQ